jgi:hypothetical protein
MRVPYDSFADVPIVCFRLVLDGVVPPQGKRRFEYEDIDEMMQSIIFEV